MPRPSQINGRHEKNITQIVKDVIKMQHISQLPKYIKLIFGVLLPTCKHRSLKG
jgi:hypothetical protein